MSSLLVILASMIDDVTETQQDSHPTINHQAGICSLGEPLAERGWDCFTELVLLIVKSTFYCKFSWHDNHFFCSSVAVLFVYFRCLVHILYTHIVIGHRQCPAQPQFFLVSICGLTDLLEITPSIDTSEALWVADAMECRINGVFNCRHSSRLAQICGNCCVRKDIHIWALRTTVSIIWSADNSVYRL